MLNRFRTREPVSSCPGCDDVVEHDLVYDKGEPTLIPVRHYSQSEYIGSFADSCDLPNLVNRYLAGDVTALSSCRPGYGDFADLPEDFHSRHDLYERVMSAYAARSDSSLDFDSWVENVLKGVVSCAGTSSANGSFHDDSSSSDSDPRSSGV